jgi:iron(II)-dependent oxidoreductase
VATTTGPISGERIAERLAQARDRTLLLVEPLADEQLNTVYSEILSPLAWDLGHIANFEELWLVQRVGGREPMDGELGRFYDAIENPRRMRNELPILRGDELRAYMDEVRARTLDVLETVDLTRNENPLLEDGFIYEMLIAHELQHNETMLQLLQMVDGYEPPVVALGYATETAGEGPDMVEIAGGSYEIGAAPGGFAYDNERPCQEVELEPFEIDRTPVTNAAFAEFVAETGSEPPMYWDRDGEGWVTTNYGRRTALEPGQPVAHITWHQADAFARWAGKRLPTELEWEAAAEAGATRMHGHVWEWTSSEFEPYPGFEAFPYPEYSEVFFGGGYRVLRGGSWATHRDVIRTSFRNWDLPERSQIFSGVRCVGTR